MIRFLPILLWTLALTGCSSGQLAGKKRKLIYADEFSKPIDTSIWSIEKNDAEEAPVTLQSGQLQLNTGYGLTVWYKKKLSGNILIEYDRTVAVEGQANDRLGDLNQFWMAADPANKMFTRKGAFNEYDEMLLYYVGMGVHENTVTRMRRYNGTVNRTVLKDLIAQENLLMPNKKYHIQIMVKNGTSTFWVDGKLFFTYKDEKPYTEGYFGFRTFKSRQLIDNFKVWQLK